MRREIAAQAASATSSALHILLRGLCSAELVQDAAGAALSHLPCLRFRCEQQPRANCRREGYGRLDHAAPHPEGAVREDERESAAEGALFIFIMTLEFNHEHPNLFFIYVINNPVISRNMP